MIQAMMVEQKEEKGQMLLNNKDEPTVLVVQPELNEELSEEGNYIRTLSQVGPRVVKSDEPDTRIYRDG